MLSKTSFFNKTVFKKNLTRFAPAWGVYTLCLLLGMGMMYIDDGRAFWFASRMGELIHFMAIINLLYAPLVAMLLFGDLFNSRMCNALHAMPLRREGWFLTNVASGLLFSLVPTATMALLSIPLLAGTCVHNAWLIGILWFIATNLEFICFFGIAVFSVFCVGNRFAMAAVYAALNGGAFMVYWIIDSIYTPMLYGVVTPDDWAIALTPVAHLAGWPYIGVDNYLDLRDRFKGRIDEMVANFWVEENYYNLIVWAVVGIVFMAVALVLYRRRRLECAGDALAIRALEPVFLVAASVGGAVAGVTGLEMFFAYRYNNAILYIFLLCGLIIGWFAGKMLIERSTRVFRLRNWYGPVGIAAALALSLVATHFDILGIETWAPRVEEVKMVTFSVAGSIELTEDEDIEQILRLQQLALEDRLEESGAFPLSYVQRHKEGVEAVSMPSEGFHYGEGGYDTLEEHRYASPVRMRFLLENGRIAQRVYYIWTDGEEGEITKEYMSRWEVINYRLFNDERLVEADELKFIQSEGIGEIAEITREDAEALFAAIKADCEARTMSQDSYFHNGQFAYKTADRESYLRGMWLTLYDANKAWAVNVRVFPDSENTLNWLRQRDLLVFQVRPGNISNG